MITMGVIPVHLLAYADILHITCASVIMTAGDSSSSKTDCTGGTGGRGNNIYRLYVGGDRWGCKYCDIEGDKWLMQDHQYRGNRK
jgi:hypothetical protein